MPELDRVWPGKVVQDHGPDGAVRYRINLFGASAAFAAHRKSLVGRHVELILREQPRHPRWEQHKYYRGVILEILSEELGYHLEEMHRVLKQHLIPIEMDHPRKPRLRSTASLSRREFSNFIEGCLSLAAWAGVYIPPPADVEVPRWLR